MPDGARADRRVRIYEVGPRDGLQNESTLIRTTDKLRFIELLAAAGLTEIEATSFVRPATIPQLADADEIVQGLDRHDGVRYPVLVPNERGMARAEAAGAQALAVFSAASDAFTGHNIGMTIDESLVAFKPVLDRAASLGWWRRAYVSTAFGCPYTGRILPAAAIEVGLRLAELGAEEICFGDTIGVAVPDQVEELAGLAIAAGLAPDRIACHFHDTRGTALANVAAGLRAGVRTFDASTGGTGGCPYAPGAAGNLATEDLVYFLDTSGWEHGVRLAGVLEAARFIAGRLGRPLASKVGQAGGWDPATGAAISRPAGAGPARS
jgi:isopropylmalate/homocitrate/citramalate synthase